MSKAKLVDDFMAETFSYGGIGMTRAAILQDMDSEGVPSVCRNRWFQGAELFKRLTLHRTEK